jgi:2-keto-3-deoxy-6-phosphogluconate aldolase
VDLNNITEYFAAGVRAVGASSSLFGRKALTENNIRQIGGNVKKFISLCPDRGK